MTVRPRHYLMMAALVLLFLASGYDPARGAEPPPADPATVCPGIVAWTLTGPLDGWWGQWPSDPFNVYEKVVLYHATEPSVSVPYPSFDRHTHPAGPVSFLIVCQNNLLDERIYVEWCGQAPTDQACRAGMPAPEYHGYLLYDLHAWDDPPTPLTTSTPTCHHYKEHPCETTTTTEPSPTTTATTTTSPPPTTTTVPSTTPPASPTTSTTTTAPPTPTTVISATVPPSTTTTTSPPPVGGVPAGGGAMADPPPIDRPAYLFAAGAVILGAFGAWTLFRK